MLGHILLQKGCRMEATPAILFFKQGLAKLRAGKADSRYRGKIRISG